MRRISIDLDDLPGTFDAIAQALGGREPARDLVEQLRVVARLQRPALDMTMPDAINPEFVVDSMLWSHKLVGFLLLARGALDPERGPLLHPTVDDGDAGDIDRVDLVLDEAERLCCELEIEHVVRPLTEVRAPVGVGERDGVAVLVPFVDLAVTVDERGRLCIDGRPLAGDR